MSGGGLSSIVAAAPRDFPSPPIEQIATKFLNFWSFAIDPTVCSLGIYLCALRVSLTFVPWLHFTDSHPWLGEDHGGQNS